MLNELGVMRNINLGHIVFTALWGAWLIKGLIQRKSFVVFMSLAFLAIVWDKELGIEAITPWPIIGAAILLTIGFSFIFEKNGRKEWEENVSTRPCRRFCCFHTNDIIRVHICCFCYSNFW